MHGVWEKYRDDLTWPVHDKKPKFSQEATRPHAAPSGSVSFRLFAARVGFQSHDYFCFSLFVSSKHGDFWSLGWDVATFPNVRLLPVLPGL